MTQTKVWDGSVWRYLAPGPKGDAGAGGKTVLGGSAEPDPGIGTDGDFYIESTDHNLYKKVSGSWVQQFNMVGPAGADGTNGTNGAPGAPGSPAALYVYYSTLYA